MYQWGVPVITDASVLIALSKMGRLGLLERLYGQALITPTVREETVAHGRRAFAPQVRLIEAGIEEGWIKETPLSADEKELAVKIVEDPRLHRGEAESIAVAKSRSIAVVLDDKEARILAGTMNIRHWGTAAVIFSACARGVISYEDLEIALRELGRVMWLSPDVITELLRRARGVSR